MAEPLPPQEGSAGSGLFASRILGIPTLIWVAGVALLVYFFISRRNAASAGTVTESGGGGTARSTTTIDRGAVRIDIHQNPQPKPKIFGKKKTTSQKGDKDVEVPDVIGRPYGVASRDIQYAGLRAKRKTPYTGGTTGENPKAGSQVEKRSTVTLSGDNDTR